MAADVVELHGAPDMRVSMVSDRMAARMLDANTHNRRRNPRAIQAYREDMEHNRWLFTYDPIRFDDQGVLLDGQQRLIALSQCPGLALPFLIIRGLPPEVQSVMDQGVKRTPGQQLELLGVAHANTVAAAVRIYVNAVEAHRTVSFPISSKAVERWVLANSDLIDRLAGYANLIRNPGHGVYASVMYAAALRLDPVDTDATKRFIELMAYGGEPPNSPINILQRKFQSPSHQRGQAYVVGELGFIFLAWNHWRNGSRLIKLAGPKGGWTPDNLPTPH